MLDDVDVPQVKLAGSEDYWTGYGFDQRLESLFPGQEGIDLSIAVTYNGCPDDVRILGVTDLVCTQVGENGGDDWIWVVTLADGSVWDVQGGCDYTGWDYQSYLDWERR